MKMVALNANGRNDLEGLWLWMIMKEMALNAYESGGSKCLWGRMALKAYENDGFECLRQGRWLQTPEIEEGGFECLTMSNDSKH